MALPEFAADDRWVRRPEAGERPSWIYPLASLLLALGFFESHRLGGEWLDFLVQDALYRGDGRWLVAHGEPIAMFLFYWLPKGCLIAFAAFLLFRLARRAPQGWFSSRRRTGYLLLCMIAVPYVCTRLRDLSGIPGPREVIAYAGAFPYTLLFDPPVVGRVRGCFPAGHASGGFALIALGWCFSVSNPRRKWLGWGLGLFVGAWMGGYQMARGEHFLSQTIVSACIAWIICVLLARVFDPARERPA